PNSRPLNPRPTNRRPNRCQSPPRAISISCHPLPAFQSATPRSLLSSTPFHTIPIQQQRKSRLPRSSSVADLDPIDKARKAVTERAELPGMSLMEHLTELRKRLIHSVYYLIGGFIVAYIFHIRLYNYIQRPVTDLGLKLNFTHPTD